MIKLLIEKIYKNKGFYIFIFIFIILVNIFWFITREETAIRMENVIQHAVLLKPSVIDELNTLNLLDDITINDLTFRYFYSSNRITRDRTGEITRSGTYNYTINDREIRLFVHWKEQEGVIVITSITIR